MPRKAKPVSTMDRHNTKKEIAVRQGVETRLQGDTSVVCPDYLTNEQRMVFESVVKHYIEAGILSSVDSMALSVFCVAINRLFEIEAQINKGERDPFDSKVVAARSKYEATVRWGCAEFCLSPQARAKIGSLFAAKTKDIEDPLLEALKDG